jgi:hypothetical protein
MFVPRRVVWPFPLSGPRNIQRSDRARCAAEWRTRDCSPFRCFRVAPLFAMRGSQLRSSHLEDRHHFAKHFEFEKPYMVILEHGKRVPG